MADIDEMADRLTKQANALLHERMAGRSFLELDNVAAGVAGEVFGDRWEWDLIKYVGRPDGNFVVFRYLGNG